MRTGRVDVLGRLPPEMRWLALVYVALHVAVMAVLVTGLGLYVFMHA